MSQQSEQIKKALDFEINHSYINAIGRSGTFSSFVSKQAREALKTYKNSEKWANILALVERYEFLDLTTRMQICKKIIHNLTELEEFYKTKNFQKTSTQDNQSKTQKPLDPNIDIAEVSVRYLPGVGEINEKKFNLLGIRTVQDLLHYFPRAHISYSDITPIRELQEDDQVSISGVIDKVTAFKSPNKNLIILSIFIKDNSGKLKINKYFQGNSIHFYLKQYTGKYPQGAHVLAVGTVKYDKFSKQKTLHDPQIEIISEDFNESDRSGMIHTAKIVPIYPLSEGISLMYLRKAIHTALQIYKPVLREFIPEDILLKNELIPYSTAIEEIHFPDSIETKNQAATRLVFNEFFLMQLKFMQLRHEHKQKHKGIQFNCFENGLVDKFLDRLPFKLTHAQERVFYNEILPDMVSKQPMHRLLQGDVGSGKTIVAFLAMLTALSDNYQSAIMVPTEILAEQHYKKFCEWVNMMEEQLKIRVGLLIGKQKTAERREVLAGIKNGTINLIVGTHALIQEAVEYKNLGLVIIDEQHRFGVKQRELLARKALTSDNYDSQLAIVASDQVAEKQDTDTHPDYHHLSPTVEKLFMTATPIPRTLALAMHGDLDMSEIDEMPAGRKPIITKIVYKKSEAHDLIRQEILKGNQAYIVFPLIDESETLSAKAATVEYEKLKENSFKDFQIGLIHGKLKDDQKEEVMNKFRKRELDILVSTTVIEVGVDVPLATVILIESAERFGLAQLHQLRGRVGRNDKQSYCLLSSGSKSETTQERLRVLERTNNGFIVAQEDLKIRGAGDLTGLKQSGIPENALQGLLDQEDILIRARKSAQTLIKTDPQLQEFPLLKKKLDRSAYSEHYNAG
jgi:ATP-dependent DNA helicase RecG